MGLFGGKIHSLSEQALDAMWYKQQVVQHNISNSTTPDYKAKTVEFGLILKEKQCKCKYHTPDQNEEDRVSFKVNTTYETNTNQLLNGNNVDMEKEQLDLADLQYQYSAVIDQMNNEYAMIRSALVRN